RLRDDDDHVRTELENALQRDIPIIPVLVHGARMPDPTELPESLRELPKRSFATLESPPNLLPDVDQVTRALRNFAASKAAKPKIPEEDDFEASHPAPGYPASIEKKMGGTSSSTAVQDTIEFGVSFPPGLRRDFIVDAWMYRRKDRQKALKRAEKE